MHRGRALQGKDPRDILTLGLSTGPWRGQEIPGETGSGSYTLFSWITKQDGDIPQGEFHPSEGPQTLYVHPCASNPGNHSKQVPHIPKHAASLPSPSKGVSGPPQPVTITHSSTYVREPLQQTHSSRAT